MNPPRTDEGCSEQADLQTEDPDDFWLRAIPWIGTGFVVAALVGAVVTGRLAQ